jgi:hypothetical protein
MNSRTVYNAYFQVSQCSAIQCWHSEGAIREGLNTDNEINMCPGPPSCLSLSAVSIRHRG